MRTEKGAPDETERAQKVVNGIIEYFQLNDIKMDDRIRGLSALLMMTICQVSDEPADELFLSGLRKMLDLFRENERRSTDAR